jgi:tetratricopeptide (TPR) repeat protein
MVRKQSSANSRILLSLLLIGSIGVQTAFPASGNYAFQAKKYFAQGKYAAAYSQYELALKESRKEANLDAEGRILTSMAALAIHAMEFEDAKKLLESVRVSALDKKGEEEFYRAYMEFHNLQGEYKRAFEIAKNHSYKKPSAVFLGEAAIAAAGSKNYGEADAFLKKICKGDSPGQLAFYKAKVADLKGESASELYEKALALSIEKKRYFTTGIILLRLAQITGSKDYAARSAVVFSELGLLKPFELAEGLK